MKKILLITSLYPTDDIQIKNNTAVCHYFAKEWIKMGYEVRVIHLYNVYPLFYYPILHLAKNILADRSGIAVFDKYIHDDYTYCIDGIIVTRMPIYKLKPHGDFSDNVIRDITDKIALLLQQEHFQPNFILGHFILPNIRVVAALKEVFPHAITTTALHGEVTRQIPSIPSCLQKINYIGYRSYPIKKSFEAIYGIRPFFMCMSGVPAEYIIDYPKLFRYGIHNFIYVGTFMHRKYPSSLIPAIAKSYPKKDFTITYVGEGNDITAIRRVAKKQQASSNIIFTGRISRNEIISKLDSAEVFIMISAHETFGLVWLEAMARGCITVASRNEGMDGIIVDGVNGFLCNAGDSFELSKIITTIKNMDHDALERMSAKAIETARNMTDHKMAQEYIIAINK